MYRSGDPKFTTLGSNHQCNEPGEQVDDTADDQHVMPIKPAQSRFAAPPLAKKIGSLRLVHYRTWVKKYQVALTMAKSTP